jgi:hypothetical protein
MLEKTLARRFMVDFVRMEHFCILISTVLNAVSHHPAIWLIGIVQGPPSESDGHRLIAGRERETKDVNPEIPTLVNASHDLKSETVENKSKDWNQKEPKVPKENESKNRMKKSWKAETTKSRGEDYHASRNCSSINHQRMNKIHQQKLLMNITLEKAQSWNWKKWETGTRPT